MSQPEVGASVVTFLAHRQLWAFLQPLAWAAGFAIVAAAVWTCWRLAGHARRTTADTLDRLPPALDVEPGRIRT